MFLIDLKTLKTLKTQRLQNPRLETCDFGIKNIKNINPPERLVFLMFLIDLKTLKTLKTQAFQGD